MTLDDLDRLAAEKIMEWHIDDDGFMCDRNLQWYDKDGWQPTRNISQAWECLDSLGLVHIRLVRDGTEGVWRVGLAGIGEEDQIYRACIEAQAAPEAIVRACLKAKGVEID